MSEPSDPEINFFVCAVMALLAVVVYLFIWISRHV